MGDSGLEGVARLLIIAGVVLVVGGVLLWLAGRLPFVGRLPGDIVVERDGFRFYAPLATSLLLSLLLTILLNVIASRR